MSINDAGDVVGFQQSSASTDGAMLWKTDGSFVELGETLDRANRVNNAKMIAGVSVHGAAAVWTPQVILTAPTGNPSEAHGIDDHGHVVGVEFVSGIGHAFFWNTTTDYLLDLAPGFPSQALDIK